MLHTVWSAIGIIRSSVCDAVHCGAQCQCIWIESLQSCSWQLGTSYSLLPTLAVGCIV